MRLRLKGIKNIYEEIAEQYKDYILLGVLPEGDKLPSCRELAIELGINPNTVERAYALLESEGLVITMPKKGVYITGKAHKKADILIEAERQVSALANAGLAYNELSEIIARVYKEKKAND